MVEPIHLLLFGSSSVVSHGNDLIKLDDWYYNTYTHYVTIMSTCPPRLPLNMSHDSAALIGGLRQAVDDMLVRFASDPALLLHPSPHDEALMQVVSTLVSCRATPPSLPSLPPGG